MDFSELRARIERHMPKTPSARSDARRQERYAQQQAEREERGEQAEIIEFPTHRKGLDA